MTQITRHLTNRSGAALFVDYGYDKPGFGDTFQAIGRHKFANPLDQCGEQDLTAHVNFYALRETASTELQEYGSNLIVSPIINQGDFLLKMGLLERAGQLGAGKSPELQATIRSAVERLASPDQMGPLFKVIALYPGNIHAPVFSELT